MSNQDTAQSTQRYILSRASIVGVITQVQLRRLKVVSRQRLINHLDKLLEQGYLLELPAWRYYSGAAGRPSPIYQLTVEGASFLTDMGMEARPSGLKEKKDIKHALAMLDCRLVLNARLDLFKNVYTDRPVRYGSGSSNVRPDNRAVPRGGRATLLFESESLDEGQGSRERIRDKVANLTSFFVSAESQGYDTAVRIVYVWSDAEHGKAFELWRQACRLEARRRGLAELPFSLHFIPHKLFLKTTDPLALDTFEALLIDAPAAKPESQVEPARIAASALPGVGSAVLVSNVTEGERRAILDDEMAAFLVAFGESAGVGLKHSLDIDDRLRLVRNAAFVQDSRAATLGGPLSTLIQPTSHTAAFYALKNLALRFFKLLGIPARIVSEEPGYSDLAAVQIKLTNPMNQEPCLKVSVNNPQADYLLENWPGTPEALAKTFTDLLIFLVDYSLELDLVGNKRDQKKRAD